MKLTLCFIYRGLELPVGVDLQRLPTEGIGTLRTLFEAEHERLFTYRLSSEVEVTNLRIIVQERKSNNPTKTIDKAESLDPETKSILYTSTLVFHGHQYHNSPTWDRLRLRAGHVVRGPCVISEMDSTTLVHPGYKAEIDGIGNILISESAEQSDTQQQSAANELDTFSVDIFESALQNARNEMDTLVTRTAMSPAIREQQDEFPVIAEPTGKMIVGQFGSFIGQFLESWSDTIDPGDIFLTNDPYSVGGAISHHNDWLIMVPIFVDEKLSMLDPSKAISDHGADQHAVAWTSVLGHMTDVGGSVPGSLPCAASSIFEEGIQIPVTKIAPKGVWNKDLLEVIYRNVRLPEWNRCDLHALVAACKLGWCSLSFLIH